ncbi:MAG: tRNA (adenosine(37)-N6)-threonylcarbamoyltransferase complex ATPase subunit type 1 TsaE [Bacteroidetes bacterium]|nr:tRNA (adenosine(37)-N6)-threonylcarbamoyltransferase complex ATPase subunit type 1 TsaE [Bacteroidota bacterium]
MPTITINNISELTTVAKKLIEAFADKKVIAFYGEMAAGKTTLIKSICEELGVKELVSSPTFSIVNEYLTPSGKKIYHFDFYRIKKISEAYDMGYEDYFYSDAYCFIEWPEKIVDLLPDDILNLKISVEGEKRILRFF